MPQIQWEAPAYVAHARSTRWYVIALSAAVLLAGYGIWTGNWTFAVAIALVICMYFLTRKHQPRLHRIVLNDEGVEFDGAFSSWKDCEDFWITHFPTYTELTIQKKKGLSREILIQTADQDPELIRETLAQQLAERSDASERFVDYLIRILKL